MAADKAFHLSLRVRDLSRSVEFYGRLFGQAPAKYFADYAKFEVGEPPLVLSLEPAKEGDRQGLDHLGVRLADRAALVDASSQLAERGLGFEHLQGVECCYARQSKIYMNDPDGHLVEIYTVDAELAESSRQTATSTMAPTSAPGTYDHLLPAAFPLPLAAAASSLSEINLRGTFNAAVSSSDALEIVRECRRALAPGGKVTTHILVADKAYAGELPRLPEPAAHVRQAPLESTILGLFEEMGFVGIELKRFSHAAVFSFGGAELREFLLTAYAPEREEATADHTVVYKGPFPAITDELGNRFERGKRVDVGAKTAALLRSRAYAEHFVFVTRGGGGC